MKYLSGSIELSMYLIAIFDFIKSLYSKLMPFVIIVRRMAMGTVTRIFVCCDMDGSLVVRCFGFGGFVHRKMRRATYA